MNEISPNMVAGSDRVRVHIFKAGHTVRSINAPKNYAALLSALPTGAKLITKASTPVDAIGRR